MSNALQALNQIPGVIGSVIFNQQDECVVSMMPPPYEPMLLSQVMQELRNALNVLNYLADSASWGAIVIRFDAGYLVVRNVNGMTVMVIAQPTLNPAMLSVGFNVAALKLQQEQAQPQQFAPQSLPLAAPPPPPQAYGRAPTSGGQSNPQAATMMMQNQPTSPPPLPPLPPSHHQQHSHQAPPPPPQMTLSGTQSQPINLSHSGPHLASASMSGSGQSMRGDSVDPGGMGGVPDAVGKAVIDGLLRALARQIGPFAKLIMKEELTKLGVTGATLGFSQYEDFINMLSRRLQDPAKRREFMTEAEALPGKR